MPPRNCPEGTGQIMATNKLLVKGFSPPLLDRELTVVGKPLNRRDALEKVTGKAEYSGDIKTARYALW